MQIADLSFLINTGALSETVPADRGEEMREISN